MKQLAEFLPEEEPKHTRLLLFWIEYSLYVKQDVNGTNCLRSNARTKQSSITSASGPKPDYLDNIQDSTKVIGKDEGRDLKARFPPVHPVHGQRVVGIDPGRRDMVVAVEPERDCRSRDSCHPSLPALQDRW